MKKTAVIVLLFVLAMIVMVIVAVWIVRGQGEYILIVSPGGTVVVTRTDNNARRGPFKLRNNIAPGTYRLGSDDDSKGIYTVTFRDTTILPGRFKLSIGNSTLDIMPVYIIFDQQEEAW